MKSLSDSLIAAQKNPTSLPYVEAKVYDYEQGIARLNWSRLYTGSETDNYHDIAFDGQGNMHRIRILGTDLYRQRISSPDEDSDYSQWVKVNNADEEAAGPCAIASSRAKVYIFWRRSDNTIRKNYSHDYGINWTGDALSSYQDADAMSAAWWGSSDMVVLVVANGTKANGELNAIVLDSSDQSKTEYTDSEASTHPLLEIYGIAATYAGSPSRLCIVFAARQSASPYDFHALYRTEFSSTFNWLGWDYFQSVPDSEGFSFKNPDLHLPLSPAEYEQLQFSIVERYSGDSSYSRALFFHAVKHSEFSEMAYTEPVPVINISSVYNLKFQSTTTHWWLSRPDGVWRAPRTIDSPLDLSADIVYLKQRNPGGLEIELENSSGKYSSPGSGDMALLQWRNELRVKLGYVTSEGNESSQAGVYWIDSWRWAAREGYSSFSLDCIDAEGLSKQWRVHKQLRWNHEGTAPKSVWEIMKSVLSRFGFCLLNISNRSTAISSFYPQVVSSPGETAHSILSCLFSMIPDLIDYQRYSSAYDAIVVSTKEPRATDESCYSYSTRAGEHRILEGTYNETLPLSQMRSIGRDTEGNTIIDSSFDWNLLGRGIDSFHTTYDPELQTTARNQECAETLLRRSSISSEGATISVGVNCGQELYDVVTITDDRCGLEERLYRVVRIEVDYAPRKGVYLQRMLLARR